jgi:DNA-binding MarR family transcriptional regulator
MSRKGNEHNLFFRFWYLARRYNSYFSASKIEAYELTSVSWLILIVIGRFAPLSPSELIDHTSIRADQLAHNVTRLLKRGLVARHQLSKSRRHIILTLTPKGRKIYKKLDNAARKIETDVLRRLTKSQRNEFSNILATIEMDLDAILKKL